MPLFATASSARQLRALRCLTDQVWMLAQIVISLDVDVSHWYAVDALTAPLQF